MDKADCAPCANRAFLSDPPRVTLSWLRMSSSIVSTDKPVFQQACRFQSAFIFVLAGNKTSDTIFLSSSFYCSKYILGKTSKHLVWSKDLFCNLNFICGPRFAGVPALSVQQALYHGMALRPTSGCSKEASKLLCESWLRRQFGRVVLRHIVLEVRHNNRLRSLV